MRISESCYVGMLVFVSQAYCATTDPHGVPMGVENPNCDDGKANISTDWNGSPLNYTCFSPKLPIKIRDVETIKACQYLDPEYMPQHKCLNESLSYSETIPTYGDHRPLWPIYGEYSFVPRQRWLHTLEHGGVVVLYDPCAHPIMVSKLKTLVKSCIRKHVITPFNDLPPERPLALVTWGCKLLMNKVDTRTVVSFIKETALHGPEGKYAKEGQYSFGLLKKARPPPGSDVQDAKLCPMLEH
ncbi:hypothetical protein HDE_06975 [Halotydeus destructor]|nr:hypothetical protein HDE_06975 [Halotydeus destructor]